MAIIIREQIMNALFALLKTQCGTAFTTYSRRFKMWDDVVQSYQTGQPLLQPALFLYDGVGFGGGSDTFERPARGTPAKVIMHRSIVVYAQMPGGATPYGADATTAGGAVFHPLLETVIAALAPDSPEEGTLTLGGLVSHCWIEGESFIMTGEIDPVNAQGMLTVPVHIMMYPSL